ncbi:DUF2797 domain-containing protein [Candidatus Roizmanbacteria bacterium]|nr:DUF2797 domain-containing protein [Candidatus Roizmanbacteria bacterium]
MQFLGVKWDNLSKKPFIKYKLSSNTGEELYYPLIYGQYLSLKVLNCKNCIGYHVPPAYMKANCKYNVNLSNQPANQCSSCRFNDSTYFLPVDILSPTQIEMLKGLKHYNYINLFGDNLIKIGVVADSRKFTRLLEQGAIATIIFSSGDGYSIRKIEDYISRALNIKQSVNWKKKLSLLNKYASIDQAEILLNDYYKGITGMLSKYYTGNFSLMKEFYFHKNLYSNTDELYNLQEIKYVEKISPEDNVGGQLIGVYGEVIFIKFEDIIIAVNSKALLGYTFEVNDSLPQKPNYSYTYLNTKPLDQINLQLF